MKKQKQNEELADLLGNLNDPELVYLYCLQDVYGDQIKISDLPICQKGYFGMNDLILDIADRFPTVCSIDPHTSTIVFFNKKDSQ